jgi:hypothetical protein
LYGAGKFFFVPSFITRVEGLLTEILGVGTLANPLVFYSGGTECPVITEAITLLASSIFDCVELSLNL